ncbi:MAG: hypothetical protein HQ591_10600 [candidate division Zixibacteria bacterium]|nr:hypothetical protein [Candidatus Tariuqbacter arcticus]
MKSRNIRRDKFDRLFPLHRGKRFIRGPMIAADHLAFLLGKPLDEVCRDGKLLAEGILRAQELYQSDMVIVFADVAVEAEAMGVELEYFSKGNPQPIRHLRPDEIKRADIASSGRLPELFRAAVICRKKLGSGFTIFFSMKDSLSLTAMVMGTEDFLTLFISDPDEALRLLKISCENQLELVATIIRAGFIPLVGAPIASGGLIGGRYFEKFAEPFIEKLFALAREMGSFACLHICGSVVELMERLAILKPDLLSIEDAKAVSMWGMLPDTIPMGYVSTDLFVYGDAFSLKKAADECLRTLPEPFVLSAGCDLPMKADPNLVKIMMCAATN